MHFSEGFLVHSLKEVRNENINEILDWWRGFTEPVRCSVLTLRRLRLFQRAELS